LGGESRAAVLVSLLRVLPSGEGKVLSAGFFAVQGSKGGRSVGAAVFREEEEVLLRGADCCVVLVEGGLSRDKVRIACERGI
jgi:hypothetical protein